jgi:ADP-ribose pyrophosphatase YjhB (NUDIX family)
MRWLEWAQRIRSTAQAGLTYTKDPFDRERYDSLLTLAAEITAREGAVDVHAVTDAFRAERGYPTPKVDVRAVVPKDGKLLFVREVTDGRWSLPGGWADVGASPAEMAVRETHEETGYEVRATKLLALLDKAKHEHPVELWYCYKIFVQCELTGGTRKTSYETTDVQFFGPEELPELSVNRVTRAQVLRMFEHCRDASLATDYD